MQNTRSRPNARPDHRNHLSDAIDTALGMQSLQLSGEKNDDRQPRPGRIEEFWIGEQVSWSTQQR